MFLVDNDGDSISMLLRDYDDRNRGNSIPVYLPWERGKTLFRCGREEPGRGKEYLIWCYDPTNFKYSFPLLSTSLLQLTASNLGKVFPVSDHCKIQRN